MRLYLVGAVREHVSLELSGAPHLDEEKPETLFLTLADAVWSGWSVTRCMQWRRDFVVVLFEIDQLPPWFIDRREAREDCLETITISAAGNRYINEHSRRALLIFDVDAMTPPCPPGFVPGSGPCHFSLN